MEILYCIFCRIYWRLAEDLIELAHNCPICDDVEGTVTINSDMYKAILTPPPPIILYKK